MNFEEQIISELQQIEDYISIVERKIIHVKKILRDTQDENIKKYIPIIDKYLNVELDKTLQTKLWKDTDNIKTSMLLKKLGYKTKYITNENEEWTTLIITKKGDM